MDVNSFAAYLTTPKRDKPQGTKYNGRWHGPIALCRKCEWQNTNMTDVVPDRQAPLQRPFTCCVSVCDEPNRLRSETSPSAVKQCLAARPAETCEYQAQGNQMSDFTHLLHDSSNVFSHATDIKRPRRWLVNLHPSNSCRGWHLNEERYRDKIMVIVAACDKNRARKSAVTTSYL